MRGPGIAVGARLRPGRQADIAWDDEVAGDALVSALVADALAIIDCLPVTGLDDEAERAVALLALVAGQDVAGEKPGEWRIARRSHAPAAARAHRRRWP